MASPVLTSCNLTLELDKLPCLEASQYNQWSLPLVKTYTRFGVGEDIVVMTKSPFDFIPISTRLIVKVDDVVYGMITKLEIAVTDPKEGTLTGSIVYNTGDGPKTASGRITLFVHRDALETED